jgi:hypothetical protein
MTRPPPTLRQASVTEDPYMNELFGWPKRRSAVEDAEGNKYRPTPGGLNGVTTCNLHRPICLSLMLCLLTEI